MSDGWRALEAAVEFARREIAAEAPDAATLAEGEAYVARVATAALSTAFLGHRFTADGLVTALPVHGGPNPDYIVRHAPVDPTRCYQLRGRINGSERIGIGLYEVGENGAPLLAAYTTVVPGTCDEEGAFVVDLSAKGGGESALIIPPAARILMVRILHRDGSPPASIVLEDGLQPRGPSLVTGSTDGGLDFAARTVRANITEYMKWVRAARRLPNSVAAAPQELAETVVGDPDTQYFLGGFDLADGEYLEVVLPGGLSGYWSLHAYNYWYEHLVTPGVHDRNAVIGSDGAVRIGIGPDVPAAVTNRIDTVGRSKGALVCRFVGAGRTLEPPAARKRTTAGDLRQRT